MTKKCVHCENMRICSIFKLLSDDANMFNEHMNQSIDGKGGFVNIIDTVAHDCKRFVPIVD